MVAVVLAALANSTIKQIDCVKRKRNMLRSVGTQKKQRRLAEELTEVGESVRDGGSAVQVTIVSMYW